MCIQNAHTTPSRPAVFFLSSVLSHLPLPSPDDRFPPTLSRMQPKLRLVGSIREAKILQCAANSRDARVASVPGSASINLGQARGLVLVSSRIYTLPPCWLGLKFSACNTIPSLSGWIMPVTTTSIACAQSGRCNIAYSRGGVQPAGCLIPSPWSDQPITSRFSSR